MYESITVSAVLLFTALCACVGVSQLCTAGVLRDEEEPVSTPLSDIGDDQNINGVRRAKHKQRQIYSAIKRMKIRQWCL